jgi:vancomycin resistance protein YoaR
MVPYFGFAHLVIWVYNNVRMSISTDIFQRLKERKLAAVLAAVFGCVVLVVLLGSLAYAGRVLPGVQLDGVKVGGMSKTTAQSALSTAAQQKTQLTVDYSGGSTVIPLGALSLNYGDAQAALDYGHSGSLSSRIHAIVRALLGRRTVIGSINYDDAKLAPYIAQIDDTVTKPVANASLSFADGAVGINPAIPGARLDVGNFVIKFKQALIQRDSAMAAPVYNVEPAISDASLRSVTSQAAGYVSAPLALHIGNQNRTVEESTLVGWIDVGDSAQPSDTWLLGLKSFYPPPPISTLSLSVDQTKVQAYVASLAQSFDVDGKNAVLSMQNGQLTVLQPSQDGVALDQSAAINSIFNAVTHSGASRELTLKAKVQKAAVNEDNLASLGISDQISEGKTFFPGSTSARMTNVRVGAVRFNDVLLSPGQVFSFGQILGDVGPSEGYLPELVILGNHEEKQYGGGLCQVASTAFRAALLGGLPIVERHNHSFAVSYYTAPYGVPGVDATIFYPQVDFKFRNDTGHYILIQTAMQGTSLTFDFYGTKTKTGQIRGPQFISGSTDSKQASETVFYRDVLDPSGNVMKTDTFRQYYQPSTNFPIEQTSTGA